MGVRALNSAVTGLQAHSTWLDVIGNNIANVNTLAYKTARAHFADLAPQDLSAARKASSASNFGGVNSQQAGVGTRVASLQNLFLQGPTLITARWTSPSRGRAS
jgi:flagellar hook protein FlgE